MKVSFVDESFWRYRDDSVIHLSYAKNLVEYGKIGLYNGDLSEGYSSNLNFIIGLITNLIYPNLDYKNYLDIFAVASISMLAISVLFIYKTISKWYSNKNSFLLSGVFFLTLMSWSTLGWAISGMENSLVILLLSAIVFKTTKLKEDKYFDLHFIFLIYLFSITRIENIFFATAAILLMNYDFKARKFHKFNNSKIFTFLILTLITHVLRYLYFGELTPTTSLAINKLNSIYLLIILCLIFLTLLVAHISVNIVKNRFLYLTVGMLPILVIYNITFQIYTQDLKTLLFYSISLVLIPVFFYCAVEQTLPVSQRILVFFGSIPFVHFLVFGPSRLSQFRIVSTYFAFSLIALLFVVARKSRIQPTAMIAIGFFSALAFYTSDQPRNLCCFIEPSPTIITNQISLLDLSKGALPIVANPDIGKISIKKNAVYFDLGLITNPLLANILQNKSGYTADKLFKIFSPDIVELHGHWSCMYDHWINSTENLINYKISFSGNVSNEFNIPAQNDCYAKGEYTVWIRSIPAYEKDFLNILELSSEKNKIIDIFKTELNKCSRGKFDCDYVFRSALRYPNKMKLLSSKEITNIFANSTEGKLYSEFLKKDPGWISRLQNY
jgi:hypothetical protein